MTGLTFFYISILIISSSYPCDDKYVINALLINIINFGTSFMLFLII